MPSITATSSIEQHCNLLIFACIMFLYLYVSSVSTVTIQVFVVKPWLCMCHIIIV